MVEACGLSKARTSVAGPTASHSDADFIVAIVQRKEFEDQFSIERSVTAMIPHLDSAIHVKLVNLPFHTSGLVSRLRNIRFVRGLDADVIHLSGDGYYAALGAPRESSIVTVLDLVMSRRYEGVRGRLLSLLLYQIPLAWAENITAISDATRTDIGEVCGPAIADKCRVIGVCVPEPYFEAVAPQRAPGAASGSEPFRLLQVGTRVNKNLETVVASIGDKPCELHIVGPLTARQVALLDDSGVSWVGYDAVSDEELLHIYRTVDALIFVSTFEGFGMPIVEAQAAGIPVITSNLPPMNVVAGPAAILVDPHSLSEVTAALERLMGDRSLRRALVAAGYKNALRFHPRTIAAAYSQQYRAVWERETHSLEDVES